MRRIASKKAILPVAELSFRLYNGEAPIELESEAGNKLLANVFFRVSGVETAEMMTPKYRVNGSENATLRAALLQIMKGENFHNFYPDLLLSDHDAGAYAGQIIQRHLLSKIKEMRPDLKDRIMKIEALSVSFSSVG